jgi:hypothetical protein
VGRVGLDDKASIGGEGMFCDESPGVLPDRSRRLDLSSDVLGVDDRTEREDEDGGDKDGGEVSTRGGPAKGYPSTHGVGEGDRELRGDWRGCQRR